MGELNALDVALVDAGVGDFNLLRATSVIPPEAEEVRPTYPSQGSLLPVVLSTKVSQGESKIAAGIGWARDGERGLGLVMETSLSGKNRREKSESRLRRSLSEAFDTRGMDFEGAQYEVALMTVPEDTYGAVVAVCVFVL